MRQALIHKSVITRKNKDCDMGWVFTDETRFYLHENETLLDGMIRTEHKKGTLRMPTGLLWYLSHESIGNHWVNHFG